MWSTTVEARYRVYKNSDLVEITRSASDISFANEFVAALWRLAEFLDITISFSWIEIADNPADLPLRWQLCDLLPLVESWPCTCDGSWYTQGSAICSRNLYDLPLPPSG